MVAHRLVDGFLHGIAQNALAELLFQQRHRHLALAEALHFDFGLGLFQLGIHLRRKIGGGQGELIAALQPFVLGFLDLHVCSFIHPSCGRTRIAPAERHANQSILRAPACFSALARGFCRP